MTRWIFCIHIWLMLIPSLASGQMDNSSLVQMGGFVFFRYSSFSALSLNLEVEKQFKNAHFLSIGPRIDYLQARPRLDKYFFGHKNLTIGYQLKFYPFYFKNRKAFQGPFIGLDPCLYLNVWEYYRSGPGLGLLAGHQQTFKKIALAFELSSVYMQNTNKAIAPKNDKDRYFFFFANLKFGFRL